MRKPSLSVIFLTVFIDLIGFGIVLPLLPRYSERFGAGGFTIGAIIASFSLMQFLFAPAWGRLSDRIGRRPVLLISNFGSIVSYGLFGLAAHSSLRPDVAVGLLLVSRVFAGICGANLSVASAYIADVTATEHRSKGMALIGVAFGLGFILGPAIGALSAKYLGLAGPGWVAAALCAFNFLLACVILVESRQPGSAPAVERGGLSQWIHILRQPQVGLLIGLFSLSTFAFACYESTLPLLLGSPVFHNDDIRQPKQLAARLVAGADPVSSYLQVSVRPEFLLSLIRRDQSESDLARLIYREFNHNLGRTNFLTGKVLESIVQRPETRQLAAAKANGDTRRRLHRMLLEDAYPAEIRRQTLYFDEQRIGYLFAYCGLVSVFIQGGVIGRLVKRFGERRVIMASLLVIAGSLVFIPQAHSLGWLLLVLGLFSVGAGINRAPTMGLLSMYARPEEQGATMGVAQSAGTLARVIAPVVATTLYMASPHASYLFAAAVAVVAVLIAWRYLFADEPGSD
jgi:MFS family permease